MLENDSFYILRIGSDQYFIKKVASCYMTNFTKAHLIARLHMKKIENYFIFTLPMHLFYHHFYSFDSLFVFFIFIFFFFCYPC